MKRRKKKQYDDDDGRVIAPMNVDGMPWYVPDNRIKSDTKAPETKLEFSRKDSMRLVFKLCTDSSDCTCVYSCCCTLNSICRKTLGQLSCC